MRTSPFIAAALAAAAMLPSHALAGTTLGSELTTDGTQQTCFADDSCTIVQTDLPGRQLTAPENGVITSWSVRNADGVVLLKVVRGSDAGKAAVATSEPATAASGTTSTSAARIPIAAGDGIALDVPSGTNLGLHYLAGARLERFAPLGDTPQAPQYVGPDDYEILFSAVVERDADGDGFGDDTQDACPADPQLQAHCPEAVAPPAEAPPGDPAAPPEAGPEEPFAPAPPGGDAPVGDAPIGRPEQIGLAASAPRVMLLARSARLRRQRLVVLVGCEGSAGERCAGDLALRVPGGRWLGSARLSIAAGASRAVSVRLARGAPRRLRGRRLVISAAIGEQRRILGVIAIR